MFVSHVLQMLPPQSTSVSLNILSRIPLPQLIGRHTLLVSSQISLSQSVPDRHLAPSLHLEHQEPPQSTSVS